MHHAPHPRRTLYLKQARYMVTFRNEIYRAPKGYPWAAYHQPPDACMCAPNLTRGAWLVRHALSSTVHPPHGHGHVHASVQQSHQAVRSVLPRNTCPRTRPAGVQQHAAEARERVARPRSTRVSDALRVAAVCISGRGSRMHVRHVCVGMCMDKRVQATWTCPCAMQMPICMHVHMHAHAHVHACAHAVQQSMCVCSPRYSTADAAGAVDYVWRKLQLCGGNAAAART